MPGYDIVEEMKEFQAAEVRYADDPVALVLVRQEQAARMVLADALSQLRNAAEHLAYAATTIVKRVDERGLEYTPNSLGEIQDNTVDVYCASVYASQQRLASVQGALRAHLDSK